MVSVAQGQSTGLWLQGLWVQIPSLTPDEMIESVGLIGYYETFTGWGIDPRACSSARIEQRPPEPCVGGSNPLRRAIWDFVVTSGPLAQLVEQLTLNQWVAGSIPARPILASGSRRRRLRFPAPRRARRIDGFFGSAARVAELGDAPDLGSGPARGGGSSPPSRTRASEGAGRGPGVPARGCAGWSKAEIATGATERRMALKVF